LEMGVLGTICLGWPQTMIILISASWPQTVVLPVSASQVARIIGVSC
jgi:hypothetical protein